MKTLDLLTVLTALLFAASAAVASDAPSECTTGGGNWTVVASEPYPTTCEGTDCTGISYSIVPNKGLTADHVVTLIEHDALAAVANGRDVSEPCAGDSVTRLGIRDCSSRSVRLNRNAETEAFELVVVGEQIAVSSSIVVKKGSAVEQCRIASLGTRNFFFDENAQVTTSESIDFKGCVVTIPTSVADGEGGEATLSGDGCAFVANGLPAGIAKLLVDGKDVGFVTQGLGYVSSGSDSCTTRVINRRIYSWCTCEDSNGDGVSDDPRPPCP